MFRRTCAASVRLNLDLGNGECACATSVQLTTRWTNTPSACLSEMMQQACSISSAHVFDQQAWTGAPTRPGIHIYRLAS